MNQHIRRLATLVYLRVVDLAPSTRIGLEAGDVAAILLELFHLEQRLARSEALRREDRLDAAELRADEIFQPPPGGGDRRSRPSRPTPHVKPAKRHPGPRQQGFLPLSATPPPGAMTFPPRGSADK